MSNEVLGKSLEDLGIGDLLTNISSAKMKHERLLHIPTNKLSPGACQPRRVFDKNALQELANSIKAQGVVQPLVARPIPGQAGHYEIIAGERRWRAAQLAKIKEVPVVVRVMDDQTSMAVALIENMLREDLNPIEQAEGLEKLQKDYTLTHEQLARYTGKSRPQISNIMRLLQLEPQVKTMLSRGELNMGQARPLLSLPQAKQLKLAGQIRKYQYSAREVEARIIHASDKSQATSTKKTLEPSSELATLEKKLKRHYEHAKISRLSDGRIKLGFILPNDEGILELIDLLGTVAD